MDREVIKDLMLSADDCIGRTAWWQFVMRWRLRIVRRWLIDFLAHMH